MIPTCQLGALGAQKTAHSGTLTVNFSSQDATGLMKYNEPHLVAVKRPYYKVEYGTRIQRYPAEKEITDLMLEANSLHWAIPLMNLVYGFIGRTLSKLDKHIDLDIPQVCLYLLASLY
jgi:hypothetical protein